MKTTRYKRRDPDDKLNFSLHRIMDDIQEIIRPLYRIFGDVNIEWSRDRLGAAILLLEPARHPNAKFEACPSRYPNYPSFLDAIRHYVEVILRRGNEYYIRDNYVQQIYAYQMRERRYASPTIYEEMTASPFR